jgi:hypothetical protein
MFFIESVLAHAYPDLDSSYDQQQKSYLLLPRAKQQPAIQILKIRPARKWTIWGTFGPKFPDFCKLVYGNLRAAGVPIGPLSLLLASKTCQYS